MADLNNNVYYKLQLSVDDYETNWENLCAQVDKQRLEFNKSEATKPLALFAQRFLTRYKSGADTTKEGDVEFPSGFDAHSEGESAREERLKLLKEQIRLDIAGGVLEQSKYDDTIKKFGIKEGKKNGNYFQETTIQKLYASHYPPFTYPTPKKPKSVSDGETYLVDGTKMKDMLRQLELCGKDNLYAFIDIKNTGTCQNSLLSTIQANITTARTFWSGKGKPTDPDVSAATNIFKEKYLDLCFGDDNKRAGYDLTLKKLAFRNLIDKAGIAGKESIDSNEWKTYLETLGKRGLAEDEAEYFLWEFCTTKKPKPIKLPGKPVSKTDKVFCPDPRCHEPNELTAKICGKCKTPIKVNCPKCNNECYIRDRACTNCGFEIGNMPIAQRLVEEVRDALTKGDFSEIDIKIQDINTRWRGAPGAEELRNEWKEIKVGIDKIKAQIAEMRVEITKQNYYKAKTLLELLKQNPHTAPQIKSDEKIVAATLADIDTKLKSLSSLPDNERKIDVCEKILETVKDCEQAKTLLAKFPPSPPTNLKAADDLPSGGFKLTWQSPNNTKKYAYRIVRKVGGCPSSTTDGTLIADKVAVTEYTDTSIEIGAIYGYTVFTQRGVAEDTVGCRSNLEQKIGEVTNIQVLPSDKMLTVSWQGSKYATGVQIERYLGNAKTGLATKITPQKATSFSDGNLTNGQYYTYNIASLFKGIDGKPVPSTGKIAQGKPQKPPPVIADLSTSEQGNVVHLKWTPPKQGAVFLFDCADKPAISFGNVVSATAKSLREKYGEPINVLDAVTGKTAWTNTATGVRYLLPVTWEDGLAVFGNVIEVVRIEDVENVQIQDSGTRLRLTWDWGKGLQKVLIIYKGTNFPTGADDTNATKREISLSEYNVNKAFVINSASQGYYFSVHAVIEQNGKKTYSPGVRIQTKQTIIKYKVAVKRKFWFFGPKYVKITVISDDKIPTLAVLKRVGKPVWNRDAEPIDEISATSRKQTTHILSHSALEENSYIRLFVKDEQLANAFHVESPDGKKLKIG